MNQSVECGENTRNNDFFLSEELGEKDLFIDMEKTRMGRRLWWGEESNACWDPIKF